MDETLETALVATAALDRLGVRWFLEWFKLGGEISDRQWGDILGVLRSNRSSLDYEIMDECSRELGVTDLLNRAISESDGE